MHTPSRDAVGAPPRSGGEAGSRRAPAGGVGRRLLGVLFAVAAILLFFRPELLERLRGPAETLDPCREPLAWHIEAVDPRFGFTTPEIREAVGEAAGVWETAAGRTLFRRDTAGSMAIHLVYDDRQESLDARQLRTRDLDSLQARVDGLESLLARLEDRVARDSAAHRRLRTAASARAYQASIRRYNQVVDQLNREVDAYNAVVAELQAGGETEVLAGQLRSERRTVYGRVVRVNRVLTVAVAGGYDELVLVLTHELGHALGLGHVADSDAVMAALYRDSDIRRPIRLHPADVQALAELCGPGRQRP